MDIKPITISNEDANKHVAGGGHVVDLSKQDIEGTFFLLKFIIAIKN